MSGTCKDCKHWEPPEETNHAPEIKRMGYGMCWWIYELSPEHAGPPPAFLSLTRADLVCRSDFGCNQFEAKK